MNRLNYSRLQCDILKSIPAYSYKQSFFISPASLGRKWYKKQQASKPKSIKTHAHAIYAHNKCTKGPHFQFKIVNRVKI